jgi:hypothetical protein
MDFPPPYGTRTIHWFPFSDQHTLPGTLGVERITTGICVDSRAITTVLAAGRRPVVARTLSAPRVRAVVLALLTRLHVGGDGFAVTVTSGAHTASFTGRRQSRATGLAAALVVRRLAALPAGVRHIDEVIEPVGFLTELAEYGFDLHLGGVHHEAE